MLIPSQKKKEIAAIKTRIQSYLLTQLFSSLKLPNPRPCNNMHWTLYLG